MSTSEQKTLLQQQLEELVKVGVGGKFKNNNTHSIETIYKECIIGYSDDLDKLNKSMAELCLEYPNIYAESVTDIISNNLIN